MRNTRQDHGNPALHLVVRVEQSQRQGRRVVTVQGHRDRMEVVALKKIIMWTKDGPVSPVPLPSLGP